MVEKRLSALDINKSRAPDDIPERWKTTYITPVHKNGSTVDVSNYRPIAKLSLMAKVFESFVTENLFNPLNICYHMNSMAFAKVDLFTATNLFNWLKTECSFEWGNV